MDRKYCKTCRHTGYNIVGKDWNGCSYIIDTGEKRPHVGEWCLGYEYSATGRSGKGSVKREDMTEEHARESCRRVKDTKYEADWLASHVIRDEAANADDNYRIWLNTMG